MQFVIERSCPIEGGTPPFALPYPVWVHLPERTLTRYVHTACDKKHWRLTDKSARGMGIVGFGAFVCEHMGYLIE